MTDSGGPATPPRGFAAWNVGLYLLSWAALLYAVTVIHPALRDYLDEEVKRFPSLSRLPGWNILHAPSAMQAATWALLLPGLWLLWRVKRVRHRPDFVGLVFTAGIGMCCLGALLLALLLYIVLYPTVAGARG